jgi:hypothetical protein
MPRDFLSALPRDGKLSYRCGRPDLPGLSISGGGGDLPEVCAPAEDRNYMRRLILGLCCGVVVMANPGGYAVAATSDADMGQIYFNAAQSGDELAQFYLGALYASGVGRPHSDTEAYRWLSRAAEQGHAQAMLIVSGLLALGRGTPKDNVTSYKWAYIVANGSKVDEYRSQSRQLLGFLEPKMTADQIASAKSQAMNFRASATPPPTGPALLPSNSNAGATPYSSDSSRPAIASNPSRPVDLPSKIPSDISKNPQVNDLVKRAPEMLRRFGIN